MNTVQQIIQLKQKHDIVEDDATYEGQWEWYSWALKHNHCLIVKTFFGKVKGFIEWVRLDRIPKDKYDYEIDHDRISTAPIAFVGNICAEDSRSAWKLWRMFKKFQKDAKCIVWHNKKRNHIYTIGGLYGQEALAS